MPSAPTLAAFAVASLLLILMPGPAMLFLVARGVSGGRRVGVMSAIGVESATATFVVATALGLTAVLATSALALSVIRYVGAAYLVWLGIGVMRRRGGDSEDVPQPVVRAVRSDWASLRQGYLVGIANPKVALFFLAFFPQFLDPARGSMTSQILVLGAVFVTIGLLFDMSYGALAGAIHARIVARRARRGVEKGSRKGRVAIGLTYIGLGGFTAATGARSI
ncbi:threonine/homoserine/homoserine lactone efflux protein [Knoellia remsis]|uniref:Threonine/homoserine/homoserine lactone efflux protein n=1 Tax=Knoellia remsis TaxID=407159 RepID=A0A2T0UXQ6_9MICO|nr:LysE family translocator [Knoellia remsis]PRY62706.1 threonine/homoserine/homoserine lactone efflux protein [Knoellia remsis]